MKKRILCFCLCLYCIGLWAANASFKKTGNDLLFLLPQGNVKLEFCTDDMFRVRHSQGTVFAEKMSSGWFGNMILLLYTIQWKIKVLHG